MIFITVHIPKGAKKIIDKLQRREIKQNKETPLELNRQSTASSTKVSSIRFRWEVILGRMNVEVKSLNQTLERVVKKLGSSTLNLTLLKLYKV